jgi:hypothetical protein
VSRADLFGLLQLSDASLAAAVGMDLGAAGKYRRALKETVPADLEEFLSKAGLGSLVTTTNTT